MPKAKQKRLMILFSIVEREKGNKLIKALGEKFDDDPTFDAIDISLPGAWGEGYKLDLYTGDELKNLIDTYTGAFKKTQLMGQLSKPELIFYASKENPVGWRGDGLGDPRHTKEIYPPKIEILKDVWKVAPVSFESFWWLCEWKRQGWEIDGQQYSSNTCVGLFGSFITDYHQPMIKKEKIYDTMDIVAKRLEEENAKMKRQEWQRKLWEMK